MVKYRDQTRRSRPAFYQVGWNDEYIYMQSRISALIVRDAWISMAVSKKLTGTVQLSCAINNTLARYYNLIDIVSLLNGGWDAIPISKHSFADGVAIDIVLNKNAKPLLNRCNKLRINTLYFNNEIKKIMEVACSDVNLMNVLFKSPSANVFVTAIKLLIPDDNEYKEKIQTHARDIYYVLRKPERRPKNRPRSM